MWKFEFVGYTKLFPVVITTGYLFLAAMPLWHYQNSTTIYVFNNNIFTYSTTTRKIIHWWREKCCLQQPWPIEIEEDWTPMGCNQMRKKIPFWSPSTKDFSTSGLWSLSTKDCIELLSLLHNNYLHGICFYCFMKFLQEFWNFLPC